MIKYMWNDGMIGKTILALIAASIAIIPFAIYGSILDEREWQAFKVSQNCVVVGKQKATSSTGVGYGMTTSGHMGAVVTTLSTPGTTGWKCDDGVTYWR